ncbi:hypothetical protein PHMEG_00034784 [Phytophthora megakarya]|uniref:Uncharacterized protein n=1 Tax=Phytophthora megakarya TaxID=4795 RepID=A0A225UQ36_9STRA|nr:hypothetical protein PHMEG_00034784 [Phytophthora megakarya]
MVDAGIITCAEHIQDGSTTWSQDEIHGAFVEGSIEHWNSASKKRKGAMEPTDCHGNFDSDTFELWFTNLCVTLPNNYGPCNIHMNGASYHKQLTNPTPSKSWLKADIRQWLTDRGRVLYYSQPTCIFNVFYILEIHYEKKDAISQLLVRVQPHRPTPIYAAQVIAMKHDHLVFFTPPYHPQLQPIELVGGL